MRWILLISLATAASALSLNDRAKRNARYAALPADVKEENLQLLFASAMWRHGDRAPEHAVPGNDVDQFTEEDFTFGGGGYGELSPEGMSMHFNLGRKLKQRYITDFKILNKAYNAKEIYIRSTDYNRTLISAYSNVAGMFTGEGVVGQNFPDATLVPDWPAGYIPIPVHTVDYSTDYIGHPDANCPRQDELYELVQNSTEYQNYINDPQISQVLKYLTEATGAEVTIDNMYDLQDPIFCEGEHIAELNETGAHIEDFYPWFYAGDISTWVDHIVDTDEDFTNGLGNPGGVNGIDVSVEIPKIRAGDTLKMIVNHVHGALACRDNSTDASCRNFYKQLKYTALSAHDTTLAAFLTILGVKKYIIPSGYPSYSAAVLIEIYEDKVSETKDRYFKVLYHANKNEEEFKPITSFVKGCDPKSNLCNITVLDDLVAKYAPDVDVGTLCNTPVNPPTTTLPPTTTTNTVKDLPATTANTLPPTTSSISTLSLFSALSVILLTFSL
ncbi:hypothetical protein PFISCL1PPCAC_6884 [Pristionchus fissidentatus]|uniref:acid phosphatase n=1 Tax=Pristionchus fissidentatus TaxID=1538716 RepID=A0AAV5V9V7_9BILA|nr:hypothetical protein PFISCL1PPCAC_6884 [Pristionchus fissidentatus]